MGRMKKRAFKFTISTNTSEPGGRGHPIDFFGSEERRAAMFVADNSIW
jgi:hypothetical protein